MADFSPSLAKTQKCLTSSLHRLPLWRMKTNKPLLLLLGLTVSLLLTSCLTQRTVSQGGRTVKQSYVIKNPVKQ
jgi:hypothetical protein